MPITPDQYRNHVNQNLQAVIDAIDKLLAEEAEAGRVLPVGVALPAIAQTAKVSIPNVYALRNDIINIYKALGWKADYHSDQRDGDYFYFDA